MSTPDFYYAKEGQPGISKRDKLVFDLINSMIVAEIGKGISFDENIKDCIEKAIFTVDQTMEALK